MNFQEKLDRLDGLMAYDSGCSSSGIHDPVFKEDIKTDQEKDALLLALVKIYLNNDQCKFEDVVEIVKWSERELDFDY